MLFCADDIPVSSLAPHGGHLLTLAGIRFRKAYSSQELIPTSFLPGIRSSQLSDLWPLVTLSSEPVFGVNL